MTVEQTAAPMVPSAVVVVVPAAVVQVVSVVEAAIAGVRTLSYPMCLLPYQAFKRCGSLRSHEEICARSRACNL